MKSLSSVGLALSLVFGSLLLALIAEVYYLLWWKRRFSINRDLEDGYNSSSPTREFFYMLCWKKPSSLSSTALNPRELCSSGGVTDTRVQESVSQGQSNKDLWLRPFGEDSVEAELLRLQNLSGPPRFLFTIKEETREDLESEDGGNNKSRKGSRTRSLSDLVLNVDNNSPFLTPLTSPSYFTPPLTTMDSWYNHNGFNPLYESTSDAEFNRIKSSPPPKFKFMRNAEEKLMRKKLLQEAENCSHKSERLVKDDDELVKDGENGSSFITLIVSREIEVNHHANGSYYPSSSSQILPLVASPPSFRHLANKKTFLH